MNNILRDIHAAGFYGPCPVSKAFAISALKAGAGFFRPWPVERLVLKARAGIMFPGCKIDHPGLLGMVFFRSGKVNLNTLSKMNGH